MTTTNIESLRTFAEQHGELQFAHLCTAALGTADRAGEEWAVERIEGAIERIDTIMGPGWGPRVDLPHARNLVIRSTDTTRPDGAIARAAVEV